MNVAHSLPSTLDVVIVGAGFCGLSAAAALKTYGVERLAVCEAGAGPGSFWMGNYDRIHLHSPWHDLPADGGLGSTYPMYKAGHEVVRYLGAYAARHQLMPLVHTHTPVTQLSRDGSSSHPWRVVTPRGECLARHAVVATSACRVPWRPEIADLETFRGSVLHSRDYRNSGPFVGKTVVVVGSGNSAAEIALDLVQGGADSVTMVAKGARHFMAIGAFTYIGKIARPLGIFGPRQVRKLHPITFGSEKYWSKLRSLDKMMGRFCQDLSAHGIPKPALGPGEESITNGRIGVIDVGAIKAIRSGAIAVRNGHVAAFTTDGVTLDSGAQLAADTVILATGFRHGLGEFLADTEQLLGPLLQWCEPMPLTDKRCRSQVHPDLWFVGWELGLMGGLHWGLWGWEVGEKIAAELETFDVEQRPADIGAAPWC